jgi:hypothetical protein
VQRVEMKPAGKEFDVEFVGDIAQMIMVAHSERKLEMGHYKSSVKEVLAPQLTLRVIVNHDRPGLPAACRRSVGTSPARSTWCGRSRRAGPRGPPPFGCRR